MLRAGFKYRPGNKAAAGLVYATLGTLPPLYSSVTLAVAGCCTGLHCFVETRHTRARIGSLDTTL